MKNLRSCPHFSLPSWTGPSPAVFGVWKPSIQSILSPLTPQKRKGGSSTVISCAPIQRWWDQSLLSLPQRTPLPPTPPPPKPPAPLFFHTASWWPTHSSQLSRHHSWCRAFAHTLISPCLSIPSKATFKVLLCTRSVSFRFKVLLYRRSVSFQHIFPLSGVWFCILS